MKNLGILFIIFITACTQKSELPGLFIKTSDVKGVENNRVITDTITRVTSDYM